MNLRRRGIVLIFAMLLLGGALAVAGLASGGETPERRFALVVGLNDYVEQVSPLQCAVNDANQIKRVLVEAAGFREQDVVTLTTDERSGKSPTRSNISVALESLKGRLGPTDTLFFFFSGHGMEVDDESYLLTFEANPYSVEALKASCLRVSDLCRAVREMRGARIVLFLDACRQDPRARTATRPEGLALADPLFSRAVLAGDFGQHEGRADASSPGTVLAGDPGQHGGRAEVSRPGIVLGADPGRPRDNRRSRSFAKDITVSAPDALPASPGPASASPGAASATPGATVVDPSRLLASFVSCDVGQRSYEWPEKEMGFFSYYLADGLREAAAEGGDRVTVRSLQSYLDSHVPGAVRAYMGAAQTPTLHLQNADRATGWALSMRSQQRAAGGATPRAGTTALTAPVAGTTASGTPTAGSTGLATPAVGGSPSATPIAVSTATPLPVAGAAASATAAAGATASASPVAGTTPSQSPLAVMSPLSFPSAGSRAPRRSRAIRPRTPGAPLTYVLDVIGNDVEGRSYNQLTHRIEEHVYEVDQEELRRQVRAALDGTGEIREAASGDEADIWLYFSVCPTKSMTVDLLARDRESRTIFVRLNEELYRPYPGRKKQLVDTAVRILKAQMLQKLIAATRKSYGL